MPALRIRWPLAAGVILALGLFGAGPAWAQQAKPKHRDTRDSLKPVQDVAIKATVEPATARPGDTVTYKVEVTVDEPWHIYAFAKAQPTEGPRATQFDFFDPAGLQPGEAWKPDKAPVRKKEPAFPNLDAVEYHTGTVVWSVPIKIPADAKPGKKSLQTQIYFQICDENSCKPPTYWTVPAATVTVEGGGGGGQGGLVLATALFEPGPAAFQAAPKHKDSRDSLKPVEEVAIKAMVEPATARPGDTVTYKIQVTLDEPWHIYTYGKGSVQVVGVPTRFDFFNTGGLEAGSTWTPDKKPTLDKQRVACHTGTVTWSIPVQIPADAASGDRTLQSQIHFQICNGKSCKTPTYWTVPATTLKVEGKGDGAALVPAALIGGLLVGFQDGAATTPAQAAAAESPKAAKPAAPGSAQESIEQGLVPFLLWSAAGGFFALLMPCVWPMVPVTVNFFVKRGQSKNGSTTGLAVTYCLAIIGIFTLVGLLFAVFVGATSLSKLGNNPWINGVIAAVLIAFGLSLLGFFEIRLPSFLLNASAKGESRGGVVGVIFMALTLTITSFTCTFPVVGGLMVMASKGSYLYPILGMVAFSTVLALPFFLLALVPGMLAKMPRSGDWMNAVKVVGGLVEIGAAFKFINTAEIGFGSTPQSAWIDSQVILAIWAVLALVCGIYLLGLFRTDHDHDDIKVGPGRLLFGSLFLFLALYLAPALFGFPPKGPIYDRLIVGILPQDSDELDAGGQLVKLLDRSAAPIPVGSSAVVQEAPPKEEEATSDDPDLATRQEKRVHGVAWGMSYDQALEEAKKQNRPVLIDFTGVNCANCRLMERSVMPRQDVIDQLKKFVTVQLYTDFVPIETLPQDKREELAEDNLVREQEMINSTEQPAYVAVMPDGQVIGNVGGYMEASVFLDFLKDALSKFEGNAEKMASTEPAPTER
jgi:thiol:disulfide interchange protein DsbD